MEQFLDILSADAHAAEAASNVVHLANDADPLALPLDGVQRINPVPRFFLAEGHPRAAPASLLLLGPRRLGARPHALVEQTDGCTVRVHRERALDLQSAHLRPTAADAPELALLAGIRQREAGAIEGNEHIRMRGALARGGPKGGLAHRVGRDGGVFQQTVGPLTVGTFFKHRRDRAGRVASHRGGHGHEALGTARIAQLRTAKYLIGPIDMLIGVGIHAPETTQGNFKFPPNVRCDEPSGASRGARPSKAST